MAERIENHSDDFNTIPQSEWVYYEVPAVDLMGDAFPTIRINGHVFKHEPTPQMAPPSYVKHVKEVIDNVQASAIRRLRPNQDIKALRQQAGSGQTAAEAMTDTGHSVITGKKIL